MIGLATSRRIVLLAALISWVAVLGDPAGDARAGNPSPIVRLGPESGVEDISRFVWFLEDASGTRTASEVLADSGAFERNHEDILNPGTASGIIWVRFDVENTGDGSESFVVSLNRASVDTAEIFFIRGDEVRVLLGDTSAAWAGSFRKFQTLAGRFTLEPGGTGRVLVRFRGSNWSALRMTAGPELAFQSDQRSKLFVFLALLGGIGTLVLYGSISFVLLGAQIVLLYALAQAALFVFFAHLAGYTTIFLWPDNPESGRIVAPAAFAIFLVSMAQFSRRFLETAERARVVDRILLACVLAGAAAILCMPLDYLVESFDARIPVRVVYGITLVCWTVLPALAIHATIRWDRAFWPIAVAWTSVAFFTISMPLVFTGAIASIPFGKNAYWVAVYLEAFFLAIAIALRIRRIRAEAFEAQQRSNESLRLQLDESRRAQRLSEERSWALQDLSEKGRLLLAAGHDSRQMLSALRNYAAGLRRGTQDEDLIRASHGIDEIAGGLKDVLSSVVEGSRSGGISDRALALDTLTASSLLGPLQLIHGQDAREKGIELRVRLSDRILVTDRVLVMRILGNLLSNAIKYTERGRILVALRPRPGGCAFQIWDTGIGIDPEILTLLLAAESGAVRVDDRREGTGSGLGIAGAVAARLGGSITARSEPGRGSVFELFLPAAMTNSTTNSATDSTTDSTTNWNEPSPGLESDARDVLLFDRDPDQAAYLDRAAGRAGLRLSAVGTMDDAAPLLVSRSGSACLILIDQHFDGADGGIHLAGKLREVEPRVPVALLSHDRSPEARSRMTAVVDWVLYKPVSALAFDATRQRLPRPDSLDDPESDSTNGLREPFRSPQSSGK